MATDILNQRGDSLRHRPIFGGVFGKGRYSLATMPCVDNGLHAVRYMVIEPRGGSVIAQSRDRSDALAGARRLLKTAAVARALEPDPSMPHEQIGLFPAEAFASCSSLRASRKRPSRRRREVFHRSNGRCHYCGEPLVLEGMWHCDHLVPRALNGDDLPLNLVAACVRCNLAKSDRTALEFITRSLST